MKTKLMALSFCGLLLLPACSNDERVATNATAPEVSASTTAATEANLTPEQLGELGAEIEKTPDAAQQLLTERGLNEQTFEQAVRKVSEDPAAARRYAEAYKKTSA